MTASLPDPGKPLTIGFFLVPKFSMMAFSSAIEPLRSANRMSDHKLYDWKLITKKGEPVTASSNISLVPDTAMAGANQLPIVIVCAGIDVHLYRDKEVFSWLRRLAHFFVQQQEWQRAETFAKRLVTAFPEDQEPKDLLSEIQARKN